jgi:hypothetical protein
VSTRPCFGPCDPSIFEWIGYGVVLLAAASVVGVAYVLAHRIRAGGGANAAFVSLVVVATTIVMALIVVPMYPRPTFVPSEVTAGLDSSGETDAIYLEGTYSVRWSLAPVADASCHLEAALYRAADRVLVTQLVPTTESMAGSAANLDSLPGAGYVIEGTSECQWRVILTPQPATADPTISIGDLEACSGVPAPRPTPPDFGPDNAYLDRIFVRLSADMAQSSQFNMMYIDETAHVIVIGASHLTKAMCDDVHARYGPWIRIEQRGPAVPAAQR